MLINPALGRITFQTFSLKKQCSAPANTEKLIHASSIKLKRVEVANSPAEPQPRGTHPGHAPSCLKVTLHPATSSTSPFSGFSSPLVIMDSVQLVTHSLSDPSPAMPGHSWWPLWVTFWTTDQTVTLPALGTSGHLRWVLGPGRGQAGAECHWAGEAGDADSEARAPPPPASCATEAP